jgi:hypothetical protein
LLQKNAPPAPGQSGRRPAAAPRHPAPRRPAAPPCARGGRWAAAAARQLRSCSPAPCPSAGGPAMCGSAISVFVPDAQNAMASGQSNSKGVLATEQRDLRQAASCRQGLWLEGSHSMKAPLRLATSEQHNQCIPPGAACFLLCRGGQRMTACMCPSRYRTQASWRHVRWSMAAGHAQLANHSHSRCWRRTARPAGPGWQRATASAPTPSGGRRRGAPAAPVPAPQRAAAAATSCCRWRRARAWAPACRLPSCAACHTSVWKFNC